MTYRNDRHKDQKVLPAARRLMEKCLPAIEVLNWAKYKFQYTDISFFGNMMQSYELWP